LVDGIKGVGLYSIVGGIDDELRDVGLPTSEIRSLFHKKIERRKNLGLAQAQTQEGEERAEQKSA
jgi:hypothetical protein